MPDDLGRKFRKNVSKFPRKIIPVVGLCSGSGLQDVFGKEIAAQGGGNYVTELNCDVGALQQEWLEKVMHAGDDSCVFRDVREMGGQCQAACARHKKTCNVQKCSWLCNAGFCCHGLSKQSMAYSKGVNDTVLEDKRGTSGETFDGVLKYNAESTKIEISENVEDLLNDKSKNRQYYVQSWEEMGFAAGLSGFTGDKHGVRTTRLLLFLLIIAFALQNQFRQRIRNHNPSLNRFPIITPLPNLSTSIQSHSSELVWPIRCQNNSKNMRNPF